ncbi:unnamed protein product [Clavelina lepadiformis]|uniref:Sulfotransferase n=1 Tax=Clavelina lepadiformis TaxID=159417 RepID=A0ABP0F5B4_CLALP
MEKLTAKIPDICRAEWDAMINFDFMSAFQPGMKAQMKEWKEHILMPTFPSEGIEYAYDNWTPQEKDVLIASFPRTGTNWTTEIVRQILYGHDEDLLEMAGSVPLPLMLFEGGTASKFKIYDNLPLPRRCAASHLPATLINVERFKKANAKIICVLRNPKDQALSWFNFAPKLPYMHLEPVNQWIKCDWPEFFENYTSGKMPMGMKNGQWYLDHILTWYPHRDDKNVMFIYYEDMKRDLVAAIRRISSFLNVELGEKRVLKIAEKCGFIEMKTATENELGEAEKIRKALGVLHKGTVGAWKERFTVAQSEAIDEQVEKKLSTTDIKFTYEL